MSSSFPGRIYCLLLCVLIFPVGSATLVAPAPAYFRSVSLPLPDRRETEEQDDPGSDFPTQIRPLLDRYCSDCHQGEGAEAEWDLEQFPTVQEVRQALPRWVRVQQLIRSRQMPPVDAEQPAQEDRDILEQWLDRFLLAEASRYADDPGPVLLRRLSNAEYNYSIQDLTGVSTLEPAAEFPEDAAAGEGFTNTGSGQGMSAAMAQKYLDAARGVAEHLVLLPDGIQFSQYTTRRDQTDHLRRQIQDFYDHHTQRTAGTAIQLQEVRVETNGGGRIPLRPYLQWLRTHWDDWPSDQEVLRQLATSDGLSVTYLAKLKSALESDDPLLQDLRQRLIDQRSMPVTQIVSTIQNAQAALWQFHPVGQLGREGTPGQWMQYQSPLVTAHRHQQDLLHDPAKAWQSVSLETRVIHGKAGQVVWDDLRLSFPDTGSGEYTLAAERLPRLPDFVNQFREREWRRTADYLSEIQRQQATEPPSDRNADLNPQLLRQWQKVLGLSRRSEPVSELFTSSIPQVQGYEVLHGWGYQETPNLLVNRSQEDIAYSTLVVPARSVTVHPAPERSSVIAWRSPVSGNYRVRWQCRDQDHQCGNGFQWKVEWWHPAGSQTLGSGDVDNGSQVQGKAKSELKISRGDIVRLVIGPRLASHVCDTTSVDFWIEPVESEGQGDRWNLAEQIVDRVAEGNPLADTQGHPEVWFWGAESSEKDSESSLPSDSPLGRWRTAMLQGQMTPALEQERDRWISESLTGSRSDDQGIASRLWHVRGPLDWLRIATQESLTTQPDDASEWLQIPSAWLSPVPGTPREAPVQLLAEARLSDPEDGTVVQTWFRIDADDDSASSDGVRWDLPLVVNHPEQHPYATSLRAMANCFPAALCYRKIVPVDEVVTLKLFHREDEHLKRLMLDDQEARNLDRLWDHLIYVSQEPLQLVVSLEQLIQFASQDRQDLVGPFESMRESTQQRADAFVRQQRAAEPIQVQSVIALADIAWRRPLKSHEVADLKQFYQRLRDTELDHESALSLLLTRILSAPDFLFKLENQLEGDQSHLVSNHELATRLSFFLGSSHPDQELSALADSGRLVVDSPEGPMLNREEVLRQSRRLIQEQPARRLAVEFGCQWLHIRDFDQHDQKNETMFPEFAGLRDDMYQESILFFQRLFADNRSVLEMIDSDRIFLNPTMAEHYGIDQADLVDGSAKSEGDSWHQIDNADRYDRGGVLAMAAVLASQSGASRTSPILRGNWVYETLLGQKLPNPPAGVPVLPEEVPVGLSARQLIEQHSSDAACANCHVRIDPFGFALEGFDVLGRRQSEIDTRTTVEDGTQIDGLSGLKQYLLEKRRDDFVRQFSRKLLGFALGRPLQLSDELLLRDMRDALARNQYRVHSAIEVIVASPQFTRKRGRQMTSPLDP